MPTLNENLLSIYNTKLEIKDAIGTNSDVFSEYPDLIRGLKNGIVPTGTYSYNLPLDMYGPYEVDIASYAYISISQGESSAYINSNGSFKPSDFGYVAITKDIVVNVPGPSGNMVIETPGNYNVSSYASVTADFEIPGDVVTVTENGDYYVKSWAYAYVSVSGGVSDPTILVTPWFGNGIMDTSGENTYFKLDIASMLDQPLLNSIPANIDAPQLPALMGAEYILEGSSTWVSADSTTNPDGLIHMWVLEDPEDPAPGGLNWLLVWVSPDIGANGYGRVKFELEAYIDEPVTGTTNWISFEILTID